MEKGGRERKVFIDFLGSYFYKILVEDVSMSNPGHNGFSLDLEEFESAEKLKKFLNDASDFGDLYDTSHTSKLKDKRDRIKWYLNPILSPRFRIPSTHTKEPIYTNVKQVSKWLNICQKENQLTPLKKIDSGKSGPKDDEQLSLNF